MHNNVKQDSNFLDKPLWFSNPIQKNKGNYIWNDGKGYTYKATYKVPNSFDSLVLLYLLLKSQQNQEYKPIIYVTEYEILKALNISTTDTKRYKRVRESLEIWKAINIKFDGNFYNGYGYSWAVFGILNQAVYRKDIKKYQIEFNSLWLQTIKDSRFFQLVNFEYYKALKRPASRRLFEILCKSFEASDTWIIKLVNLGVKLTLAPDKHRDKLYASDVLRTIKPAIMEINKISSDKELLKKANIKIDQAFLVEYEIYGVKQERVIKFTKLQIEDKIEIPNEEIKQLLKLVKKTGKRVRDSIRKHYFLQNYEYVKRNIEYSNEEASKQYSAYLCKALDQDWAIDYQKQKNPREKATIKYESMSDQERKILEKEVLNGKYSLVLQMDIDNKDWEHYKNVMILHLTEDITMI